MNEDALNPELGQAELLFERLVTVVRAQLPHGVRPGDLDAFVSRYQATLVSLIAQRLASREAGEAEHWTASKRTRANLLAMHALTKDGDLRTSEDIAALRAYSGWGGLSIRAIQDKVPEGVPVPEARGLIHEFYTPSKVCAAVAQAIGPLLGELRETDGSLLALEPSAGIGRFLRATEGWSQVRWHAVEYSALSGAILQALYPDQDVFLGPFEQWVREHEAHLGGKLGLVLSNPPYGVRGLSKTQDPDRSYRERHAYKYFLRRGLDLLKPNGLGVFLVPAGFMTGASNRELREKVLRRHHLSAAFRLPSKLFPGAQLVTDLLFWRARGGELPVLEASDESIVAGRYFEEFPQHILGREVGKDGGGDDQSKKPRWGYQVEGSFSGLPELVERPVCSSCAVLPWSRPVPVASPKPKTAGLPELVASAVALGQRVERYLRAVSHEREQAHQLWPELHQALVDWKAAHGSPHRQRTVKQALKQHPSVQAFLSAFAPSGALISGLAQRPTWAPRFGGTAQDVEAQAQHLFRSERRLSLERLLAFHRELGGRLTGAKLLHRLVEQGEWALDEDEGLMPMDAYLTGSLWPRVDRLERVLKEGAGSPSHRWALRQRRRLLEAIAPAVFDDIEGITPQQGWIPLELVGQWLGHSLERREGLVQLAHVDYAQTREARAVRPETRWCLGWINHDRTLFRPSKRRDQDLDAVRLQYAARWTRSFRAWLASEPDRKARIEHAYNRHFKGFVAPDYSQERPRAARWDYTAITPHGHQLAGSARLHANRGGLLAYDVGVGKTYTALHTLALDRQAGQARRPVILVPNSIVWKWHADLAKVLPDYRVGVVGSKQVLVTRGARRGQLSSTTDTPEERARTWARFQSGELDVVLVTFTAFARTRMEESQVRAYADKVGAIRREVKLRQRNAAKKKRLSEREQAILDEGVAAWVAERLELPKGWRYDPGVSWESLGVDWLCVDEAQNFKNLYLPEAREGGVPRFMGNAGTGSKRAWQLDFRAATVRKRTGGAGVYLLSATPAKNSPLEFYNLLQLVDGQVWERMGIFDPEAFIDRYCKLAIKGVLNAKLELESRSAVVGFDNLDELRGVIWRLGDFKTAEDVGLELPAPQVNLVEVDMDAAQDAKYADYVSQIEAALDSRSPSERGKILGLLARMALVSIHSQLDEGYTWKTAEGVDPHSPKFDALAQRVMSNPRCGHIVFVDNISAHVWVREVLVKAGVPRERIAVLNARTAKAAADRQRIAVAFNGSEHTPPAYDVVIANAIAYEGIDLQRRTCAIHHLDLPWEPATLQQRNGRGVRQGNTLSNIEINYYFSRRSQDGQKFNLIQGKLGWMSALLKSQERATNNPAAQMDLGPEEILLLISRNPEQTRQRLETVRAQRLKAAHAKLASDAQALLRGANGRFRRAERAKDPAEATRLRVEAEERLKALQDIDPQAWPWAAIALKARDQHLVTVSFEEGDQPPPLFEGARWRLPGALGGEVRHIELGRVVEDQIGFRHGGRMQWSLEEVTRVAKALVGSTPADLDPESWPASDRDSEALLAHIDRSLPRYAPDPARLGWTHASESWRAWAWETAGDALIQRLAGATSGYHLRAMALPAVEAGQLLLADGHALKRSQVSILPPTRDGWDLYLEHAARVLREKGPAVRSGQLSWRRLRQAGLSWWGHALPKGLAGAQESP